MRKDSKIELMQQLKSSLTEYKMKPLLLLTIPFLLTACGMRTAETEVVVQTEYQEQLVPIQERPKAVAMPPVDWFIITEENLEEKLAEIDTKTGDVVLFAITPKGYENLALGIGDLRRYIKDQQAVIGYYEEALSKDE